MNIVLSPELLVKIIQSTFNLHKSDEEYLIYSIIRNKNNNIILSRQLMNLYERALHDVNPDLLDRYQDILSSVMEERSLNCKSCNNDNYIQVLSDIHFFHNEELATADCLFISLSNSFCENLTHDFCASLDQYSQKRNKLLFDLAAFNPNGVDFRYSDFLNDDEIRDFFNQFYNLPCKTVPISIFDRYFNNHSLYDNIASLTIEYYTTPRVKIEDLRTKFTSSLKVWDIDPRLLHERKIVNGPLILEVDEDFARILASIPTWKISIIYNKKEIQAVRNKKKLFSKRSI